MTLTPILIADLILPTTTMSGNLVSLLINIISNHFDDKTSDDECSVMGDNSAGIYIGLILIFLFSNSTSDADSNPRPDPPLCILARTRW